MKYAHLVAFQISHIAAAFYAANYLAGKKSGKKSGKYRNELEYELSLLSVLIYSCTAVIRQISEFIQSDAPSNTLLLIPNEFGTVFQLGVHERLEILEIQYSQALAKPERETNSHNRLLWKHSRSADWQRLASNPFARLLCLRPTETAYILSRF